MAANILIIAPVLIEMSLWIYIRHRPSSRVRPLVVHKSDIISCSEENDRSAAAKDTGNVARILSSIFIAGKISGWQSL